jgi:6-phosphogluconolactonase
MNTSLQFRWACLASTLGVLHFAGISTVASGLDRSQWVYFGTYTGAKSKGIYRSRFDPLRGQLTSPELAAETRNPTFLALHPNGRFLYAVNEVGDFGGKAQGSVTAFGVNPQTGQLWLLNQEPSGGSGPCHIRVDKTGKWVLVANYGSGSIAVLSLQADGKLGQATATVQHQGSSVNPQRQEGPHAHSVDMDANNRFLVACDLGLDKVLVYRLDTRLGSLSPHEPAFVRLSPGSGPRHLAFGAQARHAYVLNELSSTLAVFNFDSRKGTFTEVQTLSTLPEDFKGQNTTAEVQLHPSGKFVYASNRGHDSVAVFAVDRKTGKLSMVERTPTGGKTPRHFTLDPSGQWLLAENQGSDTVVVFRVDSKTGRLTPHGQTVQVGSPVCAVFAGKD